MPKFWSRFLPRSVRGQVTIVLNGTLFSLFILFLSYDYRNDTADRVELKRGALEEQARILMPGVQSKLHNGLDPVREYLEEARQRMDASHTDRHVIAAEVLGQLLQVGGSENQVESGAVAFQKATNHGSHLAIINGKTFLIGRYQEALTVLYIGGDLQDVQSAIRADLGRHLLGVAVALCSGILVLNVVLWFVFHRPLTALTHAVGEIGSGNLGLQIHRMGSVEFDILATAINDMSHALAEAENLRIAQMRKARTIQEHLLPARMHLSGYTIARHFQPAESIGGDYCDLLILPDDSGLFCIADVTGHGVSAALVVAIVKAILLNAAEHSGDPGEVLGFLNRRLNTMDIPEIFVSMLVIRLQPNHPELEFAGAGHPPGLLLGPGDTVQELSSDGPVLGIGIDMPWTTQRLPFTQNDRLVVYTDGVTEAWNPEHGLFDLPRLRAAALAMRQTPPEQAVAGIIQSVAEYCENRRYEDDVTLLLIDSECRAG